MSRRRLGCGGCFARLLFIIAALAILLGAGAYFSLSRPYKGFQGDTFVEIAKGTGTRAIADQLASEGVIRFPWQFLVARALRPASRLQAGEYRFVKPASTWTVYDRIARGDIFYYEITVPEGSNMFDIAANIEQLGLMPAADFSRLRATRLSSATLRPMRPRSKGTCSRPLTG